MHNNDKVQKSKEIPLSQAKHGGQWLSWKMTIGISPKRNNTFNKAIQIGKKSWARRTTWSTCSSEAAFALKDASRNSASFLSFLILSRSEHAAFKCSFPGFELERCSSCSKSSNLIRASSTLPSAYNQEFNGLWTKMSKCFLRNNYPKNKNSNEFKYKKLDDKLLQTQYILLISEVAQ